MNSPALTWMLKHAPPGMLHRAMLWRRAWRNRGARDAPLPPSEFSEPAIRSYLVSRDFAPGHKLCYAPENSLYLARNGNVQACCYNRDAPLGRYPDQSLREIWEGAARAALQERVTCHDLQGGCQLCRQALLEGDAERVPARQYDFAAEEHPGWPTRMDFELDNACNLECVMCSGEFSSAIRKNREKLPALRSPYDEAFFAQLSEFLPRLRVANFLGGEPFLISAYYRIWDELLRVNPDCAIRLQTNGSIWNANVERLLQKGRFHLALSLDAVEPNLLRAIRQGVEPEKVFHNLRYFSEYARKRGTLLTLSFCPMVLNWRELPALLELADEHGAQVQLNTVMQPLHLALWIQPPALLKHVDETLSAYKPTGESFLAVRNGEVFRGFLQQLRAWLLAAETRESQMRMLQQQDLRELLSQLNSPGFAGRLDSEPLRQHLAALMNLELTGREATFAKDALVRFLTLPFGWMGADAELLQGAKFMDKARTYLFGHAPA